jgi:hypothetical protein
LNTTIYSIYDDSFNNLDCCDNCLIHEFFNSYQSYDNTLKQGEICFYLIEKLKNQKELLETQNKCIFIIKCLAIDSKSDLTMESEDKNKNISGNDLENCIEMIKGKQILKGVDVND